MRRGGREARSLSGGSWSVRNKGRGTREKGLLIKKRLRKRRGTLWIRPGMPKEGRREAEFPSMASK